MLREVTAHRALLMATVGGAVREVVVLRHPMVVTVFDLLEHGRRFYRLVQMGRCVYLFFPECKRAHLSAQLFASDTI